MAEFIKREKLILPGEKVILALSGGPDSMALLHILKELKGELGFELAAAHVNHGLREEADEEAGFVESYCLNAGIPCYIHKADIEKIARSANKTLEEAGRDERYRFFRELKKRLDAGHIATAHHKDDLAETVLHHIIRGTGIKGLRGIMPLNGDIIRPLLEVTRQEIEDYLEKNDIPYCIDRSNYDPVYLRNRVRNSLIPYLKDNFNPRITEALCQLADIARIENDALELETERYWEKVLLSSEKNRLVLQNPVLSSLHPAYQRRLVIKAIKEIRGGKEADINIKDVLAVIELMQKSGSSKVIHLAGNIKVNKSYGELIFILGTEENINYCYQVEVPGEVYIPELEAVYSFEIMKPDAGFKKEDATYLDFSGLNFPLFIRSRKKGDVFRPAGLKGSKKLKDYFIDAKIPVNRRDKIPLLASENEIYAILGIRVAEGHTASRETEKVLVIKRRS